MASVLIPAHQEEAVIGRCLETLLSDAAPGEFEVVVVANGCTDGTADVVRRFTRQVSLIELANGSKPAALNAGDHALTAFPRLYVDADVEITASAARAVAEVLKDARPLIATPQRELQLRGVTRPARVYLRTWQALQRARGETIGTGVYAVNEAGRRRFDRFPATIGDDRFVHNHFRRHERRVVPFKVKVWPPRDLAELVRVRTRVTIGNMTAPRENDRAPIAAQVRSLVREPTALLGAPLYLVVTLIIRRKARNRLQQGDVVWERAERRTL